MDLASAKAIPARRVSRSSRWPRRGRGYRPHFRGADLRAWRAIPAARDRVFGLAILGFALTEAVALYALVIAFIILFV